jgi:arylsulfatase
MKKNILITVVIFLNLALFVALLLVSLKSRHVRVLGVQPNGTPLAPTNSTDDREFVFKAPGRFVGDAAPPIVDRALAITAVFDTQDNNGAIVAQGGLAHGFALYVQEGELLFAVRRLNVLTTVSAGKITAGRHTAAVSLAKTGDISLRLNGTVVGTGKAAGVITMQPVDGLDVGGDRGAPVGPYQAPNEFGGAIESVSLRCIP